MTVFLWLFKWWGRSVSYAWKKVKWWKQNAEQYIWYVKLFRAQPMCPRREGRENVLLQPGCGLRKCRVWQERGRLQLLCVVKFRESEDCSLATGESRAVVLVSGGALKSPGDHLQLLPRPSKSEPWGGGAGMKPRPYKGGLAVLQVILKHSLGWASGPRTAGERVRTSRSTAGDWGPLEGRVQEMGCGRGGHCIFMDWETGYLITVVTHSVFLGYLNHQEKKSPQVTISPVAVLGRMKEGAQRWENERRSPKVWDPQFNGFVCW